MSIVVQAGFPEKNYNQWTYHTAPGLGIKGIGCGNGYAGACGNQFDPITSFGLAVTPSGIPSGSIRWQAAYLYQYRQGDPFVEPDAEVVSMLDTTGPRFNTWANFDGTLSIFAINGEFRRIIASPGAIPLDGSWHAYQLTFNIYQVQDPLQPPGKLDNIADFTFAVDNVVVGVTTGMLISTFNFGGPHDEPGTLIDLYTMANFHGYEMGQRYINMQAISSMEVDDVDAVVDYPACGGAMPLFYTTIFDNTCGSRRNPVVTGFAVDCDTAVMTITGDDVRIDANVELQGPQGENVPVTVIDYAPDAQSMRVQIDQAPIMNGQYCVTVRNDY